MKIKTEDLFISKINFAKYITLNILLHRRLENKFFYIRLCFLKWHRNCHLSLNLIINHIPLKYYSSLFFL